ncbi:phytanoyl-CoA dioxygenase family protein [Tellurirhabdus rosea]|uniref:phytanoyl-CoA dioxygenase family protein n=1 Tax=Tellurirhabdus rosea TaxID=2674997 RepID=UPI002257E26F|nr:phytanoyl-CoA dioxygenase family protein [Tellurirhabdus rosea]
MNTNPANYKQEGYVLLKGFFPADEIAVILREAQQVFAYQIKRVLGETVTPDDPEALEKAMFRLFKEDLPTFINCGKQAQHLMSLHRLATDPRLVNLMQEVGLEFPTISVRPSMLINSPHVASREEYWKLGAHQDWRSSQGSLDSVTIWFPLVNCGKELGALELAPRTHLLGLLEASEVDYYSKIKNDFPDEDYLQPTFEVGDVLLFSAMLSHRSGTNSTDRLRWSMQLRYNNLTEQTYIDRGFPNPYLYKPQAELITPNFPTKEDCERTFGVEAEEYKV